MRPDAGLTTTPMTSTTSPRPRARRQLPLISGRHRRFWPRGLRRWQAAEGARVNQRRVGCRNVSVRSRRRRCQRILAFGRDGYQQKLLAMTNAYALAIGAFRAGAHACERPTNDRQRECVFEDRAERQGSLLLRGRAAPSRGHFRPVCRLLRRSVFCRESQNLPQLRGQFRERLRQPVPP